MTTFTTVGTTDEPVVRCGSMALQAMFDTSEAPTGREGECQGEAVAQVGGGAMIFVTPGLLLVGGPALARRLRRRHAAEDAEMKRTGVWRFYRFWRTDTAVVGFAPVTLFFLAGIVTTEVVLLAIAAVFGAPWALYCYFNALRPRVVFEPAGALIVNPWSSRLVSWGSVAGVAPGYWGTTLTLRDGDVVNVWVGRKTKPGARPAGRRRGHRRQDRAGLVGPPAGRTRRLLVPLGRSGPGARHRGRRRHDQVREVPDRVAG